MTTAQIIARCEQLGMTLPQAQAVAENLDLFYVVDWSEWSTEQIDDAFRGTLECLQESDHASD